MNSIAYMLIPGASMRAIQPHVFSLPLSLSHTHTHTHNNCEPQSRSSTHTRLFTFTHNTRSPPPLVLVYPLLPPRPTTHPRYALVTQGDFQFPSPYWDEISTDAKNLVENLLQVDPRKRLTASVALQHPWFGEGESRRDRTASEAPLMHMPKLFRKFNGKRKLTETADSGGEESRQKGNS